MDEERIEMYRNNADEFWDCFGNELLLRLDEARVQICKYKCFLPKSSNFKSQEGYFSFLQRKEDTIGQSIVFEQIRTKKKNKENAPIRTKWLKKPFTSKKKRLLAQCDWGLWPAYVRPKAKKSYGQPKDLVYAYFVRVYVCDVRKTTEHHCEYIVETLWNGMPTQKKLIVGTSEESFACKFAFPRGKIAEINRCLSRNYLPRLWIGKRFAGWIHTDENVSVYMGVNPNENKNSQDIVTLITELCKYPAGAVLLAYTCFSILKPFFLSYHQLDKKSSYLKVKKHINDIISINIHGYKPEYAEKLVGACCGFFDLASNDINSIIIDGIDIQPTNSRSSSLTKLTVNEFESKILKPACVLWLNREPVAELLQSGRIIDLYVEFFQGDKRFESVSEFIVEKLSQVIYERSEQGKCEFIDEIGEENALVMNFLDEIEKCTENPNSPCSFHDEDFDITEELEYWHNYKPFRSGYAKQYVSAIWRHIDGYIDEYFYDYCDDHGIDCRYSMGCVKGGDCPGKSQCKFWQDLFKEPSIQTILKIRTQVQGTAKKYILGLGRIDCALYKKYFTYDSQHRAAIQSIKQIPASRYLDDNMVKKLAYLSVSFRIFEEMCLPKPRQVKNNGGFKDCLKEESMCLSKKIDKALVSVISKQMLDSPTNILERYILNQISSGHFARIRGKRSDDNDVTIWYDPGEKLFFLRSRTYYEDLRKEHNLQITKSQFEDELARDNIIEVANRKKGDGSQMRRSFEIKVAANGNKESVLKIRMGALSNSFAAESAVKKAIESMSADMTPYRGK